MEPARVGARNVGRGNGLGALRPGERAARVAGAGVSRVGRGVVESTNLGAWRVGRGERVGGGHASAAMSVAFVDIYLFRGAASSRLFLAFPSPST